MRSCSALSFVTHMPASPKAPRFFVGKNDRQPTSPMLPARLPSASAAPIACAASSMTASRYWRAMLTNASMIGHLAVEMHGHQRSDDSARRSIDEPVAAQLATLGDRRANGGGIEIERRGIDVAEERPRAEPRDDAGRREERERRRDDLVAGTDVERHQREQQRVGARRQAEAVLRLRVLGDASPRARRRADPARTAARRRPRESPPRSPRAAARTGPSDRVVALA